MQPTATRIRDDIHDLREQAMILEELATRRIRIPHDGTRGMISAPTPINFSAADLLDQTLALARMLATTAGLHYGRSMSVHGLLKGLDRDEPCAALAIRQDAWDIVRLVDDAAWHARQLTDPEPSHRYIGVCERCGYGVWIPETQPINETDHRCVMCGHMSPIAQIAQAHELRLLTSGAMGTAADLCHLLRACGITIKRNTITQWRKRKRLTPVGEDEQGRPVYALADVLLLRRAVDKRDCHR